MSTLSGPSQGSEEPQLSKKSGKAGWPDTGEESQESAVLEARGGCGPRCSMPLGEAVRTGPALWL